LNINAIWILILTPAQEYKPKVVYGIKNSYKKNNIIKLNNKHYLILSIFIYIQIMHLINVKASKKQLSRLRNGHKVRVKPAMEGEGINLIVDPSTYRLMTKSFSKKKGLEIALKPEEIQANAEAAPEMEGQGIFGTKFDDFVNKTIGSKAKDVIYNAADTLKPKLKAGIDKVSQYAPEIGATALSSLALAAGQPELVPMAAMAGRKLGQYAGDKGSQLAKDYLDDPSKYQAKVREMMGDRQSNIGGNKNVNAPSNMTQQLAQNKIFDKINQEQGTKYNNLAEASTGNLLSNMRKARLLAKQNNEMADQKILSSSGNGLYAGGRGLYAGGGLYAGAPSRGCGMKRTKNAGQICGKGTLINQSSPALQSQPNGTNYQFRYTMPPAFVHAKLTV